MAKKYVVRLSDEERGLLEDLVSKGQAAAQKIKHANVLLKVDAEGANWSDAQAAEAFGCAPRTVFSIRERFVEQGFEAALSRKQRERPSCEPLLDGEKQARLVQIACSEPPPGYARWTLNLLAGKLVELDVVESISAPTVMRAPKKNALQPHRRKCWVIPPGEDAAFVAQMEDVLEVYRRPYDPKKPVVCIDEQPTQLIAETRQPLPMQPGQPERYDYEYERAGTAVNFMITEPLGQWRKVSVRETKTAIDLAQEIKTLLDVDYPDAEKVVIVWDNLNTHTPASLYKAFPPEEARRLIERLEIHYTPKHGSWLDIAEIELSVMTKQCLDRRIGDIETLRRETAAWAEQRNEAQIGVDWQFTNDKARVKLKHLYPQVKLK
ncbi:IS630 family transposase [Thiorhodovibrio litoralis]|uniref:IS630 family transposase n=1 Tax=Thiorhodovibrio litoralis TaxID=2952932 RepID=UPI002B25FF99|nr:IS630 family transposase [Thiorhodovibrio litoralis]